MCGDDNDSVRWVLRHYCRDPDQNPTQLSQIVTARWLKERKKSKVTFCAGRERHVDNRFGTQFLEPKRLYRSRKYGSGGSLGTGTGYRATFFVYTRPSGSSKCLVQNLDNCRVSFSKSHGMEGLQTTGACNQVTL